MTNAAQVSVLVVEDDSSTQTFLADNLVADGYEVFVADTISHAAAMLEYKHPTIGLVDLDLPDGSGFDLIKRVRSAEGATSKMDPDTPLVVLSGRSSEIDRVRSFERGCDDFVSKPFSYAELRMRLQAVLRRSASRVDSGFLRVGDLEIDPVTRDVRVFGTRVDLSQKEFNLLQTMAREPNRVFKKAELLRDVWGYVCPGETRTLDSHVCRLRRKLNRDGRQFLVNVWGIGYRLVESPLQIDAPGGLPR